MESDKQVWMVAGTAAFGVDTPTFGPFATQEEAQKFANLVSGRFVYDAVQNRKSLCGPWLP